MSELTQQQENYRVVNGKAYITIKEAATRLGVKDNTLHYVLKHNKRFSGKVTNLPTKHGSIKHLDGKIFSQLVAHYARKANMKAIELLTATSEVGMEVFLYRAAGVELPSNKPKNQMTVTEVLAETLKEVIKIEKKQVEHEERLEVIEDKLNQPTACPSSDAKNTGYYSLADCKKLLRLKTGTTGLKAIIDNHPTEVRVKSAGNRNYYYLQDVIEAIDMAVNYSVKVSAVTYEHPRGFKFRY